ncbi:agouti-signaling protein [Larimichthys crocea]|uniref:agouti-signaling protein n=1 Tax=Larimichthys crocea TaxID=215358 RepID=UPI00054B4CCC|nr:agouti-signaling protein [Larimichthys crocea]
MKLALSFCILHFALVCAGLFNRNDLQAAHSNLSGSRAQTPQSTGYLNQNRQRPLFARRRQYERQRIHVQKPKPILPNIEPLPSKPAPKPANPNCSQLTQSCSPQSGCCDPCSSCHCRFFNAICFCRKTNSLCEKKT